MEERYYWLAFSNFPGIGPVRFQELVNHFGSAATAWKASEKELREVLGPKTIEQFSLFRQAFSIEQYVVQLEKKGVQFLTLEDKLYPPLLRQIHKAPYVLYVKGNTSILLSRRSETTESSLEGNGNFSPMVRNDQKDSGKAPDDNIREIASSQAPRNELRIIAIVGTRKVTNYGREITEMLTRDLVQSEFTIVSGLAMGVDAIAHQTTVQNNGRTIAVLGCGVDCCYPSSNQKIYDQIIESGGCIVSEIPLSHMPTVGLFPARNRIIAGISQAVLVTEGAADSGSLITAEEALKNNRRVFAVPGPITSSLSVGPYRLLKQGAVLVSSVGEILSELGIKNQEVRIKGKEIKGETEEEQRILDLLQNESLHFDEIVRTLNADSSDVSSLLTMMELKGMVRSLDNGYFSIAT